MNILNKIFWLLFFIFFVPKWSYAVDCENVTFLVNTPTSYQTYQRRPNKADIEVKGRVSEMGGLFVSTYKGNKIDLSEVVYDGENFSGILKNLPQGQDTLKITWMKEGCEKKVEIPFVGIGDIFLIAGQSNNTSVGLNKHNYFHPTLKATMFGNDYKWQELVDPVDSPIGQIDNVSIDKNTVDKGSYIPYLATKIMNLTNVPVAFIPSALGGTNISQWSRSDVFHLDRNTLYGSAAYRAKLQNGIRAILWWQGEGDVNMTSTDVYKTKIVKMSDDFSEDLGKSTPMVVNQIGQVLYKAGSIIDVPGKPKPNHDKIVQAVKNAANESSKIILGPRLDDVDLGGQLLIKTAGVHFVTDEQQQLVADRLFEILKNTIYKNNQNTNNGDFNKDGDINLVDYSIWKKEYLSQNGLTSDTNKDGKVDLLDFNLWKNEYVK